MKKKGFRALSISGLVVIVWVGLPRRAAAPPRPERLEPAIARASRFPLAITDVSVSAEPTRGIAILEIQVASTRDEADVRLRVDLPAGLRLVSGETHWEGSLEANLPHAVALRLTMPGEGTWPVTIRTAALSSHGLRYADTETVRVRAAPEKTSLIREKDFVVRQGVEPGHEAAFALPAARANRAKAALENGQIQIRGRVFYTAVENDGDVSTPPDRIPDDVEVRNPLGRVVLKLWDREDGRDRLLAETQAAPDGRYEFSPVSNQDPDGTGIDPYVEIWSTDRTGPGRGRVRVVDADNEAYRFRSHLEHDLPDGARTWEATVLPSYEWRQAFYIFDKTANQAYDYLQREVAWGNDDLVEINWPRACIPEVAENSSCFFPVTTLSTPQIYLIERHGKSPDVIIHEYGHFVLSRHLGVRAIVNACFDPLRGLFFRHSLYEKTSPRCAWSEGWADFFQMAVQRDPDYEGPDLELESVDRELGNVEAGEADSYELVVAASLWDILDGGAGEAFDQLADGFDGPRGNGIWHFSTANPPGPSRAPRTIRSFWRDRWVEERPQGACYGSAILEHHLLPYRPFAYSLTARPEPLGAGSISTSPGPDCPNGTFSEGSEVRLTARADPGYRFRRWYGVDSSPGRNPATVVMSRERTVTALFASRPTVDLSYFYSFGELSGRAAVPAGQTFTIWDEIGGCGPVFRDVAECRTNVLGQVRAYNHDCLREGQPGTLGPWVSRGCSVAEEFGYVVRCCVEP